MKTDMPDEEWNRNHLVLYAFLIGRKIKFFYGILKSFKKAGKYTMWEIMR